MTRTLQFRTPRAVVAAVLLVGLLALPLAGCNGEGGGSVAAKVNGVEITVAALDAEVAKLKLQSPYLFGDGSGIAEAEIREALLDELINRELLMQKAKELDIEVTDEQIDGEMELISANYGSEEEFAAALESAGFTTDTAREQVRWQLINEYILLTLDEGTEVTDDEVRAYYDANTEEFQESAAKRASHILFDLEDEALAKDVLQQIKDGADFAEMAREHSKDGSASEGGDLGWPTVQYVEPFEAAVEKLGKGEMADELVETQYGWHIIKVTDERGDQVTPFEEVADDIRASLEENKRYEAQQVLLEELRAAAEIEILDPEILAAKKALPSDDGTGTPVEAPAEGTGTGEGTEASGAESE